MSDGGVLGKGVNNSSFSLSRRSNSLILDTETPMPLLQRCRHNSKEITEEITEKIKSKGR